MLKSYLEAPASSVESLSYNLENNWYVLALIEGRADGKQWYDIPDYTLEQCIEGIPLLDNTYKNLLGYVRERGGKSAKTWFARFIRETCI